MARKKYNPIRKMFKEAAEKLPTDPRAEGILNALDDLPDTSPTTEQQERILRSLRESLASDLAEMKQLMDEGKKLKE